MILGHRFGRKGRALMKTLIFGAGPLGSLYAHILHEAGKDVRILARNKRYEYIKNSGTVLVDEFTGERKTSPVPVVDSISGDDTYDLVIVLIRKNKLHPVFQILSGCRGIENILFMGNNALGFDEYLGALSENKVLIGFPAAGGSLKNQVVHYVDSERPGGKRMAVVIGEPKGPPRERTRMVASFLESGGIPAEIVQDMDGWLKYHAALVLPIAFALYKHDCDNYALARDREGIGLFIKACRETGAVLEKLGFRKRQPFKYNLFYWLPEFVTAGIFKQMFGSRFAEIAFAMHARDGIDEMIELTGEFRALIKEAGVETPAFNELSGYLQKRCRSSMS
jgi:2-dehydropantoate 2-reductase